MPAAGASRGAAEALRAAALWARSHSGDLRHQGRPKQLDAINNILWSAAWLGEGHLGMSGSIASQMVGLASAFQVASGGASVLKWRSSHNRGDLATGLLNIGAGLAGLIVIGNSAPLAIGFNVAATMAGELYVERHKIKAWCGDRCNSVKRAAEQVRTSFHGGPAALATQQKSGR